uniref:Uncharacterized protein n=1 Tax=Solanum lycopersicum TaxID=4081 RepID=A0A3Q7G8R3_SOLLC
MNKGSEKKREFHIYTYDKNRRELRKTTIFCKLTDYSVCQVTELCSELTNSNDELVDRFEHEVAHACSYSMFLMKDMVNMESQ